MQNADLKRFVIENNEIVTVFEFDDGVWEFEPIEPGESYSINGSQVIKVDQDDDYIETSIYSDRGDGVFVQISETREPLFDTPLFTPPSFPGNPSFEDHEQWVKFNIVDNEVKSFYEFDDGVWQLESIDRDETFSINGNEVVKQEYDDGLIETKLYRDRGDGIFELQETRFALPTSTELVQISQDAELVRLYLAIFDREPDVDGFYYWDSQLDSGLSFDKVINHFIDSEEFKRDYEGAQNRDFVIRLYENVLSRQPDTAGLEWWSSKLDNGNYDPSDLVTGFVESQEFIASSLNTVDQFLQNTWSLSIQNDVLL